MVHVSNAEGRRKMLAFSAQPEPNLNTIIISPNSKENSETDTSTSESSHRIINNSNTSGPPTHGNNALNLSCIIEEDSSSLNIMMTPEVVSGNTNTDDPNCNVNNNLTISETDDNSNNSGAGFNDNTTITTTSETHARNQESTFTTTGDVQTMTVIREKRGSPDKLSHPHDNDDDESDESEELERRDSGSGTEGLSSITTNITAKGRTRRKSPPNSQTSASTKNESNTNNPINANISNENDDESAASTPTTSTAPVAGSTSVHVKQSKFTNNSKQVGLKRVSFGSSKGSMVETLVYESPVTEESEIIKTVASDSHSNAASGTTKGTDQNDSMDSATSGGSTGGSRPPSRVRVTFFESEKPLAVSSPESDIVDFDLNNMTLPQPGSPGAVDGTIPNYNRQMSGEIGWENPFRPDGDLSKEADQIVELIKEGKPINDETLRSKSPSVNEAMNSTSYSNYNASPPGKGANGSTVNGSGSLEVQRGVAPGTQGGQVEHVVLKKKKGCCVIQ